MAQIPAGIFRGLPRYNVLPVQVDPVIIVIDPGCGHETAKDDCCDPDPCEKAGKAIVIAGVVWRHLVVDGL
jgi:hypothetical protein